MKKFNNKRRLTIICFIVCLLLICFYLSLLISVFINGTVTLSPFTALRSVIKDGYSLSSFIVLFIIAAGITLYLIYVDKDNLNSIDHPIDKNRVVSKKNNYGKAEFERPEQYRSLAQIRPIEKCVGHIYGMLDKEGRECIDFFPDPKDPTAHVNNHIFAIGASGSGKTYTTGLTYCLQSIKMEHSLIATDPKGELYASLAEVFRANGYIVRRLNFNNPDKSDGWDCMKAFSHAKTLSETQLMVDRFATAIISQIAEKSKDIFQGTGPLLLLRALILRLVLDPTIPAQEKTIYTIYKWLQEDLKTMNSTRFNKDEVPIDAWPCLGPWESFYSSSENVSSNIRLNLASGLNILNTKIIADILSTDDIDISLPGREKCAYFIQFPVPNDAYAFPISLFFTMTFDTLQLQAIYRKERRNKKEVDFFLDEFAQIGVLPAWEQRMSTVRSYGLNVFMIVQTMSQFVKNYKTDSNTIISNCATWLVLGANDYDTANEFCKRIGQTTIEVATISEELYFSKKLNSKKSVGTGKTDLLSPDEIMKLPPNTLIILLQRHNPIYANSVPHTLHPLSKMMSNVSDDDDYFFYDSANLFDLDNLKLTRIERKIAERKRIALYNENHFAFVIPDTIDDAPYGPSNFKIFIRMLFSKITPLRRFTIKTTLFTSSTLKARREPTTSQICDSTSSPAVEISLFDYPNQNCDEISSNTVHSPTPDPELSKPKKSSKAGLSFLSKNQ